MGLRRKLLLLLLAFASFAVLAATATIHAIRWQVADALDGFEDTMGRAVEVDQLDLELKQQIFYLRSVIDGSDSAVKPYFQARDAFFARLRHVARFAAEFGEDGQAGDVLQLAEALEAAADRCLSLTASGRAGDARVMLETRVESELVPALSSRLLRARATIDEVRNAATRQLGETSARTVMLTVLIAAAAGVLVVIGSMLIRRWLITPVAALHDATQQFAGGRFEHRCELSGADELGRLGAALNLLAERVSEARADLLASEAKHRSLFRNLRDAAVICDADGRIVEYHDGDSQLLGVEGQDHVGRGLLEVWPEWQAVTMDWPSALRAALHGRRLHVPGVALQREGDEHSERYADFVVYPVDCGQTRRIAIAARDVSAWHRLQRRLRRAGTMEAVGTLAGGLAHDFNNLLASVTTTLSMLADDLRDSDHAERIDTALRACRQAAGLSKRLLNFASSAHGDPQRFRIDEMLEVILNSLDPSFLEGIEVRRGFGEPLTVRMDRDQFTQVVLNLIRNAREAMPDGGRLAIRVESVVTRDPEEGIEDQPYVVLVIEDSGQGIAPDVRQHIFEPLFTTKSRASGRGRGLGLAIVYSAVKNAGGFVRLHSTPGTGTTFRVHLPAVDAGVVLPPAGQADAPAAPAERREPDTVDDPGP